MREKHGKQRRGWLKVHVAVNVGSKRLLSMEVTEENTLDSEVLRPLLKDANIEEGLMDGAYDTSDAFEFMKSKGVDCPGIKIRENAIVGKDASSRSTAVLEFKKWATRVGSKCISTVEDGRLKASSHRSSAFLVRRFGRLLEWEWFQRLKDHSFCIIYL